MEQTSLIRKRIDSLDLIKAVAVFLMLVYHGFTSPVFSGAADGILNYFNYFFEGLLSVCVPLFFIVNGGLLLNKPLDIGKHIKKTVLIIIVTAIWDVIDIAANMFLRNEMLSAMQFVKALWTFKYGWSNHLWFMMTLVVVYIFFPVLKAAYDSSIKSFYFFTAVIFIMTFGNTLLNMFAQIVQFILGKNFIENNFNFFNTLNPAYGFNGYALVYFMLGGLLVKNREKFLNNKKFTAISAVAIPVSAVLLLLYAIMQTKHFSKPWDIVWSGYDSLPTLVISVAIFIICQGYRAERKTKISKFICILSTDTLGIYLVQTVMIRVLKPAYIKTGLSGNIISDLFFAFVLLIVCLIITELLKKIPVIRKLVSF
jgi:surface polysaccharide O-acyltransferase-like enzyme